ncbi:hypothetical protein [Massilia puerhi]|uniref:hypothetical protein n=1 Tax=Massilia puerhi TaxID=2681550 RepID=UPI00135C9DCE|nr:hypothetical protein [Massilia puerhi]
MNLASAVTLCDPLVAPIYRSTQILRLLLKAVIARPRLAIAFALLILVALAGTMTYTGFLVVGVLADYLGTGRVVAGLILGGLFARFPWIRNGKLRIVGLLPKPVRRPLIIGILALCALHFGWQGDAAPALLMVFAMAFLLAYPWLRRAVFDRITASVFKFEGGRPPRKQTDDFVIEGEFREKKE